MIVVEVPALISDDSAEISVDNEEISVYTVDNSDTREDNCTY